MANIAQCIFCFEVLTADLENRRRLPLSQCEELWDKYQDSLGVAAGGEADGDNADEEEPDDSDMAPSASRLRAGGVSRLQGAVPAGGSGGSTPSSGSASSSSTVLSAASKASSKSSLPSLQRKSIARTEPEYPVFVTWNEVNSAGAKSLRGCVGTFEAAALSHNLETYAITSAFNDHRFSPIASSELPRLSCSLTLLTNFTPCESPLDWTLGTHGLRISFTHHGRRYGSTYLPDVAPEQGWSKEETVVSLMRKAGWNGSRRDWTRVSDLKAIRYEGDKASVSWSEFRAWRDWLRSEKLV